MTVTHAVGLENGSGSLNDVMNELFLKLDEALNDVEAGRVQTIDEAWKEIDES